MIALSVIWVASSIAVAPSARAVPPSNDDFDAPTNISSVPFTSTIDTSEATRADDDPDCVGGDGFTVWYAFIAPSSERFQIDTFGSDYDTTLAVFTGSRGNLTSLACNDDAEGRQSRIKIDLNAGEPVFLMAASFVGETGGSLVLNISVAPPPPPGDDFDQPVAVDAIPFSATMDLIEATTAFDDPSCDREAGTVWLAYTAAEDIRIRASLDTEGGSFLQPNAISAYVGSRGSLEQLGCYGTSDSNEDKDARITVAAPAGETVYFMVSTFGGIVVNLDFAQPPPANDAIANATEFTSLPFEDTPEASGASIQPEDPEILPPCELDVPLEQTLWYSYVATNEISLKASATDPDEWQTSLLVLATFSGASSPSTQLACTEEVDANGTPAVLAVTVPAGQRVWFMVGLADPPTGEFTLEIDVAPPPPANDDFDNALVIDSLPFETTVDMFSATGAADDPLPSCGFGGGPTTWFVFEAIERIRVTFQGFGPLGVAAYEGTRGNLRELACNPENGAGVTVTIEPGRSVYFMVQCCRLFNDLQVLAEEVPPPPNDDVGSATLITQSDLPYEPQRQDIGLSTPAPGDPRCLGKGGSVWYRFQPGFDMVAEVATDFVDADYVVAVLEQSPRDTRLLGCADDNVPPPDELPDALSTERFRFWAKAGTDYLIGVGSPDTPGGLQLTLTEVVPVLVDPISLLLPTGEALIRGTVRCSHALDGRLDIFVNQTSRHEEIFGSAFEMKPCHGGIERWSVIVAPDNDRFLRSRVSVFVDWLFIEEEGYAVTSLEDNTLIVRPHG